MKKNRRKNRQKNRSNSVKKPSVLFFSFKKSRAAAAETVAVNPFDKIVVSPHIQAEFKQGDQESITIEKLTIASEKMNIEVEDKILKVFLQDAEAVVNLDDEQSLDWDDNSVYKGIIAKIVITYKDLGKIAVVGEEKFIFKDAMQQEKLKVKLYGKTKVFIHEAAIENLDITSFGKNYLEVSSGTIPYQNITAFGEDEINLLGVENEITKVKSLGNGKLKFNVSKKLNVTSLGDALIQYKGDAKVSEGFMLGKSKVEKL